MATGNRTVDHVPGEEWRPVPAAGGWYSASSFGRIRRNAMHAVGADGRRLFFAEALMGSTADSYGYLQVRISRLCPYPRKLPLVHRMVFESFNGPLPSGTEINHRNGVKTDNRIKNLEAVPHAENMAHASRHGLMPAGERAGSTTLRNRDAVAIVEGYAAGARVSDLARRFSTSSSTVSNILAGRVWGSITGIERHRRPRRRTTTP